MTRTVGTSCCGVPAVASDSVTGTDGVVVDSSGDTRGLRPESTSMAPLASYSGGTLKSSLHQATIILREDRWTKCQTRKPEGPAGSHSLYRVIEYRFLVSVTSLLGRLSLFSIQSVHARRSDAGLFCAWCQPAVDLEIVFSTGSETLEETCLQH